MPQEDPGILGCHFSEIILIQGPLVNQNILYAITELHSFPT